MSGDQHQLLHGQNPERRSVRKRSFNKEYDVDFARLLGGSNKVPRTGYDGAVDAAMPPHVQEELSTAYDGFLPKPHLTVTTTTAGVNTVDWSDMIMDNFSQQPLSEPGFARDAYGSPTGMPFYQAFSYEDEQPAMLEMPMSSFHGYDTQLISGAGGEADYLNDAHGCQMHDATLMPQGLTLRTGAPLPQPPAPLFKREPDSDEANDGAAALDTTLPSSNTPHAPDATAGPAASMPPPSQQQQQQQQQQAEAAAAAAADASPPLPPPLTPRLAADQAVLVAKILTKSDASSKRVILPRVSVEANMPWIVGVPNYQLAVQDVEGRDWRFIVKSWSNGENPKPVYVVEQISEYMRIHRLGPGDAVGIVGNSKGRLTIMANTPDVRDAALRTQYSAFALQQGAQPPRGPPGDQPATSSTSSDTLALQEGGGGAAGGAAVLPTLLHSQQGGALAIHSNGFLLCPRTPGCNRPAGHQGWCSGHKGFKRRSNHK